ncbi:flavin monoamine oxidase family protein [Burkholderia sp. BCC1644]|uniref:flavin monoamine oxidase family protein n=1 Tax=Burkholderia sp. BCC1644 TaxID=2676293 RepID=UPI001592617F|nr:flavin monoamine oxidase family protein [Burkholderia sp. BCC1644]
MATIDQSANHESDVLIIGAGLSGMKAALELRDAGKRVLILEARDRVGGRSMPGEVGGQTVDFGGQWVGASQKLLREQATALGVPMYRQYTNGNSLVNIDGKVHAYTSTPKLPFLSTLELGLTLHRWKRDMQTLPVGAPWLAENALQWDAMSIEVWIDKHVDTTAARDFARLVTSAITCTETLHVSYLFFLECLRQGGGLETMMGVDGGAQQDKFLGGAWQIPKRMADRLNGCIVLDAPVSTIEQDENGVRAICPQRTYEARYAIVTAPPALASRIRFTPPLPAKRAGLLQRMQMGAVIKMHVAYPTPFWRRRGLNGSVASVGRHLGFVFDQSPADESVGVLVGLIEGNHALELSGLGKAARREHVIADLVHYFGDDAAAPLDYADHDWTTDEWALGGYASHMPPGVLTSYGDSIREPFGRIHWAGTETATECIGYFEGALESGIRAADEVIKALR